MATNRTSPCVVFLLVVLCFAFCVPVWAQSPPDSDKLNWDSCMMAPGSILAKLELTVEFVQSQGGCVRGDNMTWEEVQAVLDRKITWSVIRIVNGSQKLRSSAEAIKEKLFHLGYPVIFKSVLPAKEEKDEGRGIMIIQFTLIK